MGDLPSTCVAFDLETTGLNPQTDSIIEIGAIRFDGERVLDTFHTLVNPRRPLGRFVQSLTGIQEDDLHGAPPLEAVRAGFEAFLGDSVLVGHNAIAFDCTVLGRAGIQHASEVYDTQDLASILLPGLSEYSLSGLAQHLGIDFPVQHRALPDAEASRQVFLALKRHALTLPPDILGQVAQWLAPTGYRWRSFFRDAWEQSERRISAAAHHRDAAKSRLPEPVTATARPQAVAVEEALTVLASASQRTDLFLDFDDREVQRQMVAAVTEALNAGRRLIVEAGTGTGKSLAYLIPAACHARTNGSRVIVSTNTINLQEQLTRKDIPTLQQLLPCGENEVRACQLKGRRNYLCLRRYGALRQALSLSDEEALLASKILVWLNETETGDRAELRLSPGEEAAWSRLSADGADCTAGNSPFVVDGSCFLQRARRQAEASHIVVVNHALLLSDTATGGHVLPPYQHLVVDEAHHLEEEASRQFGFRATERDLAELLDRCEGLPSQMQSALRASPLFALESNQLAETARGVRQAAGAARPRLADFCERLKEFLSQHTLGDSEQDRRLHLNRAMRVQPDWGEPELAWENLRLALNDTAARLERLHAAIVEASEQGMLNADLMAAEAASLLVRAKETAAGLAEAIERDDPQRVVWLECERSDGGLVVAWVPLSVDELLRERLYEDRCSVVLTGATLSSQGRFDYIQERLGLMDAETLALGSPFDFQRAVLVLAPQDVPEPSFPGYADALARAIIDLTRASRGRALVLFTSHGSLRAAHAVACEPLAREGINVLAQGIDGSPRQLIRALQSTPNVVLLGTSSFWEGVDVPGDALSLLIMARLPFAVPTDPVFAARSALYDDPFSQYAVPQAVLRFKQGFGRLIRTKTDRGVLVVLDQRIVSKTYGPEFLGSLPACTRSH